jgi:hypothetical protein
MINFEFRMFAKPFPYCGLRIITLSPRTIGPYVIIGHILDEGIKDYAIATRRYQIAICLQFREDMRVGVIRVQKDENLRFTSRFLSDLRNYRRVNA